MEHDYILKYIRTTDERSDLVNLVEKLIENNFKNKPDPLDQSPFSQKSSELIYGEINRLGLSNNKEGIEKILEKLLTVVKALPEIRITVAIRPTEKLMTRLKEWANINKFTNAIFNIEVKSDIVGGAIIMSPEGEYKNYSLSNQLNTYFTERKQDILNLL